MTMSPYIQQKSLADVKNSSNIAEITKLQTELFNPYRLVMLNCLYRMDFLSFTQLKEITAIKSDGNLVSHLRYLETHGFISVLRRYAGKYPKRFYQLTEKGKNAVDQLLLGLDIYLDVLKTRS